MNATPSLLVPGNTPCHLQVLLECFSCYSYSGNSSALDSHSEEHCNAAAYCVHCRDAHQVRSRQCPRYRLEQDI
ncbi:hypothetical protein E2C01_038145 [Portunus trituberculatus]|uniref:Uncharacterized protein n=1 Tax=Portunus trituberculatus TaxID=210409 RepID=A0A5B7FDE0_PORTR|nr:hypothetical protein [Portunus trituberculatus]